MVLRRNVLIFHAGALGDFVLTWPLALAAGRLFPQSRIFYVTHGQKGALAEKALRLDSADIESGWHALYGEDSVISARPTQLLAGSHTIFSFMAAEGDLWTRRARRVASDAQIVTLRPIPPGDFSGHVWQYLLEQLRPFGAIHAAAEQILHSIADRGLSRLTPPAENVVIHPGSGSRCKCWPLDRFITLARRLREKGRNVRLLLGPVEVERFSPQEMNRLASSATIVQPQTCSQLYDQLKTAALYVGNDSGPAHLAGIMGVATLALFGPTSPAVWRPLGPRVRTLRADPIDRLSLDEVESALEEKWG